MAAWEKGGQRREQATGQREGAAAVWAEGWPLKCLTAEGQGSQSAKQVQDRGYRGTASAPQPQEVGRVGEMKRDASIFHLSGVWDAGPAREGTDCHRRGEGGQGVGLQRMAVGEEKTEGCSTASKSCGAFERGKEVKIQGGPLKNSGIFGTVPGVDAPGGEKMRGVVR